ncbi:enoyl-CoA hydratase [Pseudonocardiaceae bacterium YIM PH 21723]|nr:enoyl-CoA hydratase [Pseudonocardiaceae bacterium YIM PH 21723]
MSDSPLLISDAEGVRTFTLNRPESYNSVTVALKEALLDGFAAVAKDDGVRAVVITGAGKAFCAGQDLNEHVAELRSGSDNPLKTVEEHYNPLLTALTGLGKPVIAAINGTAAGAGAAIAYACDLRIASPHAKFKAAFTGIGLTADSGASWTLPRLIGYGRAMELFLLDAPVTAERALELGMITRIAEDPLGEAQALATRLAAGPTTAYAKVKEAMLNSASAALSDALAVEARTQAEAGRTADHREAVDAFLAKRKPDFTGH